MSMAPVTEMFVVVIAQAIVAWVITYGIHSTLLCSAAWLLDLRRAAPPMQRATLWRAALVMAPLTATLHVFIPRSIGPLSMTAEPVSRALAPRPEISAAILAVWFVVVLVGLGRWIHGEWRMRLQVGPRQEVHDASFQQLVARHTSAAGMAKKPRLTASRRLVSPAAIGWAEVCLPSRVFHRFTPEHQDALLAHEVAHVARRDPFWCGLAAAISQLLWFQPLNRFGLARLKEASEHAADDFAIHSTGSPLQLAGALATLAPLVSRHAIHGTAAAGSPLIARVARMLDGTGRPPASLVRRPLLPIVYALAAALLLCAGSAASPDTAADAIPWLAPQRTPPNERMLEVRRFNRALRDVARSPSLLFSRASTHSMP